MKYRMIAFSALLIIALAALVYYAKSTAIVDFPKKGSSILVFGDDYVTGYGVQTAGSDFVTLLSKRLEKKIINAGANSDTAASALGRIDADVLNKGPRIVIILLGRNDASRGISEDETLKNLGTIIDRIHNRGAAVILLGVADSYKQLARQKKVNYISNILKDVEKNDAGHKLIADRVEPVLKKLLK